MYKIRNEKCIIYSFHYRPAIEIAPIFKIHFGWKRYVKKTISEISVFFAVSTECKKK